MKYGLPYKGSKNKIAKRIIEALPSAETFVDVFAGGCAITHAALLSGKYKRIIANDIDVKIPMLFKNAINGNLPADYDRFVSRDEFNQLKDSDAIVACCWSFGNNKESYLWNEDTSGAKELAFKMVKCSDEKRRLSYYKDFILYIQNKDKGRIFKGLERLQRLESLEKLQRLESLETNQDVEVLGFDFKSLDIPQNALVYCDPPYAGTSKYNGVDFDSDRFWEWAREVSKQNLLAVSEYKAPDDFVPILEISKTCSFSRTNNAKKTIEKLFVHESQKSKWNNEFLF